MTAGTWGVRIVIYNVASGRDATVYQGAVAVS
jgi:hypothetical protein